MAGPNSGEAIGAGMGEWTSPKEGLEAGRIWPTGYSPGAAAAVGEAPVAAAVELASWTDVLGEAMGEAVIGSSADGGEDVLSLLELVNRVPSGVAGGGSDESEDDGGGASFDADDDEFHQLFPPTCADCEWDKLPCFGAAGKNARARSARRAFQERKFSRSRRWRR